MTSTCTGAEGLSFGFINAPYIEQGQINRHFNNYGGEDRMWLSPEGGPFSLWFKPGDPQDLEHWFTAPALNERRRSGGVRVEGAPERAGTVRPMIPSVGVPIPPV